MSLISARKRRQNGRCQHTQKQQLNRLCAVRCPENGVISRLIFGQYYLTLSRAKSAGISNNYELSNIRQKKAGDTAAF